MNAPTEPPAVEKHYQRLEDLKAHPHFLVNRLFSWGEDVACLVCHGVLMLALTVGTIVIIKLPNPLKSYMESTGLMMPYWLLLLIVGCLSLVMAQTAAEALFKHLRQYSALNADPADTRTLLTHMQKEPRLKTAVIQFLAREGTATFTRFQATALLEIAVSIAIERAKDEPRQTNLQLLESANIITDAERHVRAQALNSALPSSTSLPPSNPRF